MLRSLFISLTFFLAFFDVARAQVNYATVEGTNVGFDSAAATGQYLMGTIGRNPFPFSAPLPTSWWSFINIRHRNGGADGNLWGTQIAVGMTDNSDRMFFRGQLGGPWTGWNEVFTTAMPRVLINKPVDDGATALQVKGNTSATGFVAMQESAQYGARLYSMHDQHNRARFAIGYATQETGNNAGSNFAIFSYDDNGAFRSLPLIIERNTGNVGIGIGDGKPKAKLAVGGTVLAQRVKVSINPADWPDYVFSKDYQLPPLAAVANYISQHQHLPEIPSAAEVAAEGHDLGEMNKKLLKKVEELTLYLIDHQKQLAAQQKEQLAQQREIARLKELVEKGR